MIPCFVVFFSNSFSWTEKLMHLLLLWKYLTYPLTWGSFMHNGIGTVLLLCVYPIKYFSEPVLPYKSFLDNAILLFSILSILTVLLFLWNSFLLIHCLSKIESCFSIFILNKEKKIKKIMLVLLLYNNSSWCSFIYFYLFTFIYLFFFLVFLLFFYLVFFRIYLSSWDILISISPIFSLFIFFFVKESIYLLCACSRNLSLVFS